ncbi:L-2-amino-thiazoline-4-carboxylic acid hydrolase [Butyrivibrio sp. AC2005]
MVTVFCDSDDVSFGNISDNLKWGRKKTIGRGDDLCDFKFTIF